MTDDASRIFQQALKQAETCWRAGDLRAARNGLEQIAQGFPDRAEPCADLGWIAMAEQDPPAAHFWFSEALHRHPDHLRAHLGAGRALLEMGQPQGALSHYRVARPDAEAFYGEGEALTQLGDLDGAMQAFARAAGKAPSCMRYHYALSQCGRFVADDPRLVPLKAMTQRMAELSEQDQVLLHFALAKAADELGQHEDAMAHWSTGNQMARALCPHDPQTPLQQMAAIAEAFSAEVMQNLSGLGHSSDQPVFIIGMPRSGTTLVEQILASHPDVYGAGETMYLPYLVGANLAGADFPFHVSSLSGADLKRLGAFYLARLATENPEDTETSPLRMTDKLPANFLFAGLIHLMLPNARIIHVRRDPLDTCFSCYTNLFSQNIDYAYDLRELGRYYQSYERLMAHWRDVLPQDRFMDVEYEDLVGNMQPQAQRLLSFCGLGWDPAVLDFPHTRRTVHTLSARDVRRPLYTSSVGRARPYLKWLDPLQTALEENVRV